MDCLTGGTQIELGLSGGGALFPRLGFPPANGGRSKLSERVQLVSTGYHRLFRLMERSGPATNVRAATGAAPPASIPVADNAGNSSNSRALEPVFVGGAGRSGTTILARLIGEHSRYYTIPFEIRFHTG